MKKIYSTENRILLKVLQSSLKESGITSIIKNEEVSGPAAGEIPPVVATPEVWIIDDEYYDAAQEILQQELARMKKSKLKWKCPQCGEILGGQFGVCWKCGHSNPTV